MQVFRKRLKERARQLNLADAEVARRSGLSERRYGHYVTGRNEPNLETLARICRALDTTPNYLLGFEGPGPGKDGKRARLRARLLSACNVLEADSLTLATEQVEALVRHQRKRKT